jgi:anthranilate synthase component 1
VVGGERFGRYSFIGLSCAERIEARGRTVRRLLRDARGTDVCLEQTEGDPFEVVRSWLARQRVAPVPAALRFGGGLAGYFGYEAVRHIEKKALANEKPDPLGTPDMLLLVRSSQWWSPTCSASTFVVYADPQQRCPRVAKERWLSARARLAGRCRRKRCSSASLTQPNPSRRAPHQLHSRRPCAVKEYISPAT